MRIRLAALPFAGVGLAVVLTACDNVAEYTVINQTDEQLITWALLENCSVGIGNENDYLREETIAPRERHRYFDVFGAPAAAECVLVATTERRLVLSEPYEDGGTYTIKEPLQPFGGPIPEQGDLPGQSWPSHFAERLREHPLATGSWLALVIAVAAAGLFALFITARFFYRYYVRKT